MLTKENSMPEDTHLQLEVIAELNWEPSVTAAHIGVAANAGVITLTGEVESYAEKHAAEMAARRVKGVKAMAQEIKVQLPFERERGDGPIAEAILDRLSWDVSIPSGAIQVTVTQGWVMLTGIVDQHFRRQAAEQNVRRLQGVVGVSNQISIKPQINTANIGNDISCALHRSWFPDPDAIAVTAEGGKVRLTGIAHSWHAREVAGETAWGAPGATDVENLISVV
jgi:osmotically-inducible protein OsmY